MGYRAVPRRSSVAGETDIRLLRTQHEIRHCRDVDEFGTVPRGNQPLEFKERASGFRIVRQPLADRHEVSRRGYRAGCPSNRRYLHPPWPAQIPPLSRFLDIVEHRDDDRCTVWRLLRVDCRCNATPFPCGTATAAELLERKRSFRPWNQRGRFHSPRPILAVEGAFPIPSQGPEPDILFRLVGLPVPVVAPVPLGGPDAGPAGGPVNGTAVPGERPPAQGREDVAESDRDAGSPA